MDLWMHVAIRVKNAKWSMPPGSVRRVQQNLTGSELLRTWSVCTSLASNLLQIVEQNILFDIEWVEVGRCVNASGNSCQVDQSGACLLGRSSGVAETD